MFLGAGELSKELQKHRKIRGVLIEILTLPQNQVCYCTIAPEIDTCVLCRARDYVKEV
jgi:hypothetical protein